MRPEEATVHLLDGNVLVALLMPGHVHHGAAAAWFEAGRPVFATCPITQGTLLRLLMKLGELSAADAVHVLTKVQDHEQHRFWPDDIDYRQVRLVGVVGHRQITDAYLASLARQREGRLVTFDAGLAQLHADVTQLLPHAG